MSNNDRDATSLPSRRDVLKAGAAAGIGLTLARHNEAMAVPLVQPTVPLATPPMEEARIGFVGVGGMGMVHVRNLLSIAGARFTAICDIDPAKVTRAQDLIE
ncbi:MAG: twin-arginine translocation signal domain-containing protein, partial [Gemmatimonadales bacterium]